MHRTLSRLGGFVIYPRVVPDWRQFFSRDDAHTSAKERLQQLTDAAVFECTPEVADGLIEAFTRSHNAEALTQMVRIVREKMDMALQPHHYHALIRVLSFDRDKESLDQLFGVVFDREAATQETYARMIDALHCLGPRDVLQRILDVVSSVHEAYNGNLLVEDAARYGPRKACPVLSSLLHHVTHDVQYPSYLPIVVAAWMQSLGATLTDWDYVNIVSALMGKQDHFATTTRRVIGMVPGCAPGAFALGALVRHAIQVGDDPNAPNPAMHKRALAVLHLVERLNKGRDNYWQVVEDSGIVNLRATSLRTVVVSIVRSFALRERGLGPEQVNALPAVHTVALLHSTLRNDFDAVTMLPTAVHLYEAWQARYPEASIQTLTDANAEDMAFHPHFLIDLGMLLHRCSLRLRVSVAPSYTTIADLVSTTATDAEVANCGAHALLLMTKDEEAVQAWRHILSAVDASATRVPFTVRTLVKNFVTFCALHPRRNSKMTAKGLAEREKWAGYLHARDTALALFGTGPQARDTMRHLFYNKGVQQALRNHTMIEKDVVDVCKLFPGREPDGPWRRDRMTSPWMRCQADVTPRHLWDPEVVNPYPQCMLKRQVHAPGSISSSAAEDTVVEDYFPTVWEALMSSNNVGIGAQQWYLKDPEMYVCLLRCLIQRLDWEAAAQLTLRCSQHFEFTSLMDMEVQAMFVEVGDPAGHLVFKTATKLYDGRIHVDAASKRDVFQAKMGDAVAMQKVANASSQDAPLL